MTIKGCVHLDVVVPVVAVQESYVVQGKMHLKESVQCVLNPRRVLGALQRSQARREEPSAGAWSLNPMSTIMSLPVLPVYPHTEEQLMGWDIQTQRI